ncbi:MAG TPA: peptidoglycan-binding protein [Ottowia sp.]|uniref:peptidoglycan-binding protein n=1 Tax=Ottowia sp. TaxID=1898956 RepID=UPI002CCD51F8|nr:peptidoglycan-binding protein [Ottowia sp.]HMN20144.1 peptidoglycan-binding protein [Ottowia sp.]
MAFSYPLNEPGIPYFYNVDFSVGARGHNRREDVLLVQALLRIFYYEVGFENCPPPPGENGIAVDGFYGSSTQRHINHVQQQFIAVGNDTGNDGLLDPFRSPPYSTSLITKQYYTLVLLNDACAYGCIETGLDNFVDLPLRADIPIQLRNALATVKTEATRYHGQTPEQVYSEAGAMTRKIFSTLSNKLRAKQRSA